MFQYRTYLGCFGLGLLATLFLTPMVARVARHFGALDRPANRKIHDRTVPLMGGIGIFFGIWLPLGFLCFYDNLVAHQVQAAAGKLSLILAGGVAMLSLGVVDDIRGLNARWKFSVQFIVALALVAAGVGFNTISVPYFQQIHLGALGPIISVLWLVGIANALNLIDGIDGLAAGVALLLSATLSFLAILKGEVLLAVVMLSLAGACLGFLRYNFSPAKVFLGDSGSLMLGMTLAVSAALGSVKAQVGASLLVPVVLLGYPIADTFLAMARRYLRGKSMFSGDASHIHHRLLLKGLDHRQVCLLVYSVCLGFCLWTIAIEQRHLTGILLGTLMFLAAALIGMRYLGYSKHFKLMRAAPQRNQFRAVHHFTEMIKAKLGIARTIEDVIRLLGQVSEEFKQPVLEIALPEGPLGPALSVRVPEATLARPLSDEPRKDLHRDQYHFDDTGLRIQVYHEAHLAADEFWTEKRMLFAEICRAANQRLAGMIRENGVNHAKGAVQTVDI